MLAWMAGLHAAAAVATDATSAQRLDNLANRFVREVVTYDLTISYWTGIPTPNHDRLADRSAKALAAFDAAEAADPAELNGIDATHLSPASRPAYAVLKEQLDSDLQVRVCKAEL